LVDEFLFSSNYEELQKALDSINGTYHTSKAVCLGHVLLYSFAKAPKEIASIFKACLSLFDKPSNIAPEES
jgi:hypothetical protein